MSHYIHFSIEEREMSMIMTAQVFSLRAIARELKTSIANTHNNKIIAKLNNKIDLLF